MYALVSENQEDDEVDVDNRLNSTQPPGKTNEYTEEHFTLLMAINSFINFDIK